MPPGDILQARSFKPYVIVQREGDLVLVPSEAPHQVLNVGRSIKFAWNRLPSEIVPHVISEVLPLYKKKCRAEIYRVDLAVYSGLQRVVHQLQNLDNITEVVLNNTLDEMPPLFGRYLQLVRDEWHG